MGSGLGALENAALLCKKQEAEASTDAGLVCVPRIVLVPSQSHTNTNSVSHDGKILGMYLLRPYYIPDTLLCAWG